MAPVSRKEGLVNSPDEGQTPGSKPEETTLATAGYGEGSFILPRGNCCGQLARASGGTCLSDGLGPRQRQGREKGDHGLLLPGLWLRVPNTVGLRHKSPRGRWPRPS